MLLQVVHEDIDVSQEPFLEQERTAHLEVTPTAPAGTTIKFNRYIYIFFNFMYTIVYLINKCFALVAVDADHCMRPPSRKRMWRYQLDRTLEETGREESEGVDTDVRILDLLQKKKPIKK